MESPSEETESVATRPGGARGAAACAWLRRSRRAFVLSTIALFALLAWLLERTVGTFLAASVAAGAFFAAYFAFEQAELMGRAIAAAEQANENAASALADERVARAQALQPHLLVRTVQVERTPRGRLLFSAPFGNNGQGAALDVTLKGAVVLGPAERPRPLFENFTPEQQVEEWFPSIAPNSAERLSWYRLPTASLIPILQAIPSEEAWQLTLYWWAEYGTANGGRESSAGSTTGMVTP